MIDWTTTGRDGERERRRGRGPGIGRNLGGLVVLAGLVSLGACSAPGGPDSVTSWNWGPDAGGPSTTPAVSALTCTPAQSSISLPARSTVMSAGSTGGDTKVYTEDVFNLFKGTCGGCHVSASLGNFHVSAATFATDVDQRVLAAIQSEDPKKYMPPAGAGGAAYSSRAPTDPIVQLANLLSQWIAQGRPEELFTIPSTTSGGSGASGYALSPEVGMRLTNLGDCIPSKSIVASSTETMSDLDAFFASTSTLPDTLAETDLTTLDGTALAETGVIAYSPQYPLWTDDAGKLRYIRVPRGKSITFDKATQTFDIPPNTRFYKTFLKKVVDSAGNERYRKLETRVILSRPDRLLADGTAEPQALYGTYIWSDDEMSASLSNVPLNDHTGFTDRLIQYTLDEPRVQAITDSMPPDLKTALEFGTTQLKRHYAIPGSQRCVQCHMGSPSKSFILGFIPLQIARRPDGTGGSYESTGADELTQLQRFIDYGLITGMTTPADVLPLEDSQGTRKARNPQELQAQAYLLGNCAHCHNARGFPSVKSPALKDVLDFMPSAKGGVFQFPLERMSPLRSRGIDQDVPIPYLTPSLREYPVASEPTANWTPKWVTCQGGQAGSDNSDPNVSFLCQGRKAGPAHLPAPWRSLVYRNVDTPFMYADDLAIFPHMPMNSPGYDCRAAPLMGDWMVSIPAARKNPEIDEDRVPAGPGVVVDTNPQPYVEVLPSDPGYAKATTDAAARLAEYHAGRRYSFCPDTSDIVDPAVVAAAGGYPLVPAADLVPDPANPGQILQPNVGVPIRAHFVVTDLTDPLGDWYPRRSTWPDVLVKDVVDDQGLPASADTRKMELEARQTVLDQIEGATLSPELRAYVLKEAPFGLWQPNPSCNFASVPKVADIPASARPAWMTAAAPAETAPVYMQSPGSAVFTNICINCHGPQADSKGLLADALSNMTGGTGRVANFRDGLFGPAAMPGSNRARVFGPFATQTPAVVTGDDWAARYMAWMALGGTLIHVPDALLNIVATTPVVGVRRSRHLAATVSPNMLKLAQALCAQVLVPDDVGESPKLDEFFFNHGRFDWSNQTGLIDVNGDAQMWQTLCSMGNRTVVRVPWVASWNMVGQIPPSIIPPESLYYGDGGAYPADAPVLDDRGHVTLGIKPDNTLPMCFRRPTDPAQRALADQYLAAHPVGGAGGPTIPYCPDSLFADPKLKLESEMNDMVPGGYQLIGADRWAARGAINAGFAVFLYLDQLVRGQVVPKPPYNHCEQLAY